MAIFIDQKTDIIAIVDMQSTFMTGGELPVPGGEMIIPMINRLTRNCFDLAFATQDWHPLNHSSFAINHPNKKPYDVIQLTYGEQILWPLHAVQNTQGAQLHHDLEQNKIIAIIHKGFHPAIDSYSAFFENDHKTSTGLASLLNDIGIKRIFFCGLALDFCVAYSAMDAVQLGFQTFIIEDACRGIAMIDENGVTTVDKAKTQLKNVGVKFITANMINNYC